ncbi:MAG: hypothetical protein Q9191_002845 [Dirinaria sp. TL-2023a]
MISGPKGSGKSTFARMLVNAMLTRSGPASQTNKPVPTDGVAFLDVDPGQPEFSPPGELSLVHLRSCYFGPPFTHPLIAAGSGNHLVRAHHVGVLSPKEDPKYYMSCAVNLLKTYQQLLVRYPSCPLIVNCAGWVQGTGLELLLDLIKTQYFSDVVYTSTRGPQEVVESLTKAANGVSGSIHLLTSQDSSVTTRTSADLRAMQTISYFHLDEPEVGNLRWASTPVTHQVPLVVHWSGDKQALFAVMALDDFDPDTLFTILNGCVVGLVAIEDDQALLDCRASGKERQRLQQDDDEHLEALVQDSETVPPQPNPFVVARVDCTSDSDSDNRSSGDYHRVPGRTESSTRHLMHPCISRNSEDMPYIKSKGGRKRLDPALSHCLGQALVRGIDLRARCFHLLTPVPSATLQRLHQRRTKIVLVRGKLDTPKWAFQEEYENGAAFRRKLRKENPDAADHVDAEDLRQWADRTPYISGVNEPRIQSASAKVWKVRRDLKPRNKSTLGGKSSLNQARAFLANGGDGDSSRIAPKQAVWQWLTLRASFQISLAHFCENDGPTSIVCTQVLPVSCPCSSLASVSSSIGDLGAPALPHPVTFQRSGNKRSSSTGPDSRDLDEALAEHAHAALHLQHHPVSQDDRPRSQSSDSQRRRAYKVLGDDGGCASCTMSIPEKIRSKLPSGAPGSPGPNGKSKDSSPVLRSREAVHACGSDHSDSGTDEDLSPHQSSPDTWASDTSMSSCHTHTLEFVTTSKPMRPNTYSILRRASIRTLSCEQLPRGLTAGRLFFGDPVAGYVIAYKFRLTDAYARGRQRHYALLALAGYDPGRAFKATSTIWRSFERIATRIIHNSEKTQRNSQSPTNEKQKAVPISSFLTQRTMDPDGFPRRGGAVMRPRGLAEIVGNDLFFAELHRSFVGLLQCLGRQLGGLAVEPPTDEEDMESSRGSYDGRESHRYEEMGQLKRESLRTTRVTA